MTALPQPEPTVVLVGADAAEEVLAVTHAAFAARPPLDPPPAALSETVESVAVELAANGGLLARLGGRAVGSLILADAGPVLALRRFGVLPDLRGAGVAGLLIAEAERLAQERGLPGLRVDARVELPGTVRFWEHHGFVETDRAGVMVHLLKLFPTTTTTRTAEDTRAFAAGLAGRLRAGDLVLLTGDLGAGKTTFTQGLGEALGVRGPVTSPTFVIARVHPSLVGGPPLVHVDAYRLGGTLELDDLDLDTALEDAVTVVEWGGGIAEGLAPDRVEVTLLRGEEADDLRTLLLQPVGARWLLA